jgi:hypothetical protein
MTFGEMHMCDCHKNDTQLEICMPHRGIVRNLQKIIASSHLISFSCAVLMVRPATMQLRMCTQMQCRMCTMYVADVWRLQVMYRHLVHSRRNSF